ncbi:MAG TPA: NUDIX domain-containing protein, partial [Gaiellaceae bacterium]|nr:NUDIX domain-containing protein [Gaiellaceae bacterium]
GLREKIGHDLLFWPAVACMVADGQGRVLFVLHAIEGYWTFPAGAMDPGERPAEAAARECLEEAGIVVEPVRVVGVYGGPSFQGTYANGDRAAWVTTLFEMRHVSGEPAASDDETADVRWMTPEEAFETNISHGTRAILERVVAGVPFD